MSNDAAEVDHYRIEDGVPCIDIRLEAIERMFDNRDPAPFRDRDLDPDLAAYLIDCGEDLLGGAVRVVFWIEKPCPTIEVEEAFRAHFRGVISRIRRTRRDRRRVGQVELVLAVVLVIALLSLSQYVGAIVPGSLGIGLKEGLVISSWVVMWRPIETLVYDWIPARRKRQVASMLFTAPVDVRAGTDPAQWSAAVRSPR